MKKRYIIGAVAGLGLITALMAGKPPMMDGERCHGFGKHQMMGGHMEGNAREFFKKLRTKLDLDDKQKSQIKSIVSKQKDKMREKFKEIRKERKAMMSQGGMPDMSLFMSADKFDKVAFKDMMRAKQAKRAERMREMSSKRLDQRAETLEQIFDILTPKQRTKLIELSKQKGS